MKIALINCFETYSERVMNVYEYFVSKGHEVHVLVSDFKHFEKIRYETKEEGYIQIHVPEYKRNLSVERLKSHAIFAKQVVKEIEKLRPQMIYALIPPNSLVKELAVYRGQHNDVKLIYDIIDLWPETMPIPVVKKYFPFTIWRKLRDKNIKNSDYVITECNLYQKVLNQVLDGNKTSTLYLVRKDDGEKYEYIPKETLDICYLGSINNIIDIDTIYRVLKQLATEYKVNFHIIGKGENKSVLIKNISEIDLQIIDHGTIYDKKAKMNILTQCDFGLNIMKKTVCVGLTMKSIDYFEAGLPVINNIQGDTFEFVEQYGVGINLDARGYADLSRINEIKSEMSNIREKVSWLYRENFLYDVFSKRMDEIFQKMM